MRRVYWLAAGLAMACACSISGNTEDSAGATDDSATEDIDETGEDTASPDFGRVRVSGGVRLADGQVVEGTVVYTLYESAESEESCTQDHALAEVRDLATTEPDWVYHWAELTLLEAAAPCGVDLPLELRFGLGGLYPEIVPLLDKYGVAESKGALQGFYAAFPEPLGEGLEGEVYAMGYAGTAAAIAGEGEALSEAPFPDGLYLFEAVYFLQLP